MSDVDANIGSLNLGGNHDANQPLSELPANILPSGAVETAAAAHTAGWVKPIKYDYDLYNSADAKRDHATNAENGRSDEKSTAKVPLWASHATKYEWKDEFGEVAPRVPELEEELFNDQYLQRRGDHLDALQFEVTVTSESKVQPIKNFSDAGLHPVMLENLQLCKYTEPTPIQAYCIPSVLQNRDVIAVAQTGSGKTAAFLVPTLSKLMGKAKKLAAKRPNPTEFFDPKADGVRAEPLVLIIVPTRELAVQIFDEARRLCYRSMLRPCVVYGGGPSREQGDELRRGCDILIGTPGRLIDFLHRGHLVSLRRVRYTIIDEADELVTDSWAEAMKSIMAGGDSNEDADHRYMLFSATFPKGARALAKQYLDEGYIKIHVGRAGSTHRNINQTVIYCEESKKRTCIRDLLLTAPPSRTMIFVNSKKAADFLDDFLYNNGMPSTSIHSDRTQREREDALRAFKSGKAPILVTTAVSARGLDIRNVMHVVNYDLPSVDHGGIHEYIHRIGRTARIGHNGVATSLYNDRNEDLGPMLAKILVESGQEIPDFLEQYKPEDGDAELDFDDESDDEVEATEDAGGDSWGGGAEASTNASADASAVAEIVTDSIPEEPADEGSW